MGTDFERDEPAADPDRAVRNVDNGDDVVLYRRHRRRDHRNHFHGIKRVNRVEPDQIEWPEIEWQK